MYIGLAIAVIAFFVLSFFNKAVFGGKADAKAFTGLTNFKDGVFVNQKITEVMSADGNFFKVLKEWMNKAPDNEPKHILPVVKTDLTQLPNDSIVWFGHSSYLLRLDGKSILVDPVFNRASPIKLFGKPFATSYQYSVDDFEDIDILVITHDHYDHLDYETVKALIPKTKCIITSLGVDAHLKSWGANTEQLKVLNWHESVNILDLDFTSLPARHFSGRKFKRGETLWSSFALKTAHKNIYLGGDSGYDSHFKEIGENYGPFDLAILECGQYGKYWPKIHLFPHEVLLASTDLKAKVLLPVHWAKFSLSTHGWTTSIDELMAHAKASDYPVCTPQLGAVLDLNNPVIGDCWWKG
ncbi:MBL fold metallo-hydrolase [Pedobacter alpinus]|uniref:MBL fold metallo-hydrolase n=1 Tax=Pedobacter alpinus TaxID=1590643 RepID=A0ABW5TXR1_9SPHI